MDFDSQGILELKEGTDPGKVARHHFGVSQQNTLKENGAIAETQKSSAFTHDNLETDKHS